MLRYLTRMQRLNRKKLNIRHVFENETIFEFLNL